MEPTTTTTTRAALVMWHPVVAGVLYVWKKAHVHFQFFQGLVPSTRDITTDAHLTKEVANTLQESLSRVNLGIVVHIKKEVVSVEDCDSPKALALYKAQAEDINRLIAAIQDTEEEYMDNSTF